MIAVMIAGAVATLVSLLGTRFLIVFFGTRGRGQPILGKDDHGPEHHMLKQGTPTMGGLAIVVAAFVGWIVAHVRNIAFSDQAMIVWVGVLAMSFMGFLDDWIKVRKGHNRGIFWKQKNYITMLMSFGFAWWLVATTGISETISFVRAGDLNFEVPTVGVGDLGGARDLGHDQRRQRHRRARRARRRLCADGVRGLHDHRLLGVP